MRRKPPGKVTKQKTDTHQNDTEIAQPIPVSRSKQTSQQNSDNSHSRASRPPHDSFYWVNLIVLVLTFLAAGGAAFEAKRLADGTDMLVRDAENTAKTQLRAYVGIQAQGINVECPDCSKPSTPERHILLTNKFSMIIKNFGLTPAYHPFMCAPFDRVDLGNSPSRQSVMDYFTKCDAIPNKLIMPTIWPGEGRPYQLLLNDAQVEAIIETRARRADAFLATRITYDDIFGIARKSYFCFQYVYDASTTVIIEGFIGCGSSFTNDE